MKVLVTGVSGFVGSLLAKACLEKGEQVYGFMRRRAKGEVPPNIALRGLPGYSNFHVIEGDLTDYTAVAAAVEAAAPQVVYHLGAQAYVPRSFECPEETIRTNVDGTLNLLESIRNSVACAPNKIIFAGSSEEYGAVMPHELPLDEDSPLRPNSPYAVSKVTGEHLMHTYRRAYGLPTVVSRAFNHEGAGRGDMYVTSVIAKQVAGMDPDGVNKMVLGNVNAFRDWSHVSEIVNGYRLLADKGVPGKVYVQGSGTTQSVLTFALTALESKFGTVKRISTKTMFLGSPTNYDGDYEFNKWLVPMNDVDYHILDHFDMGVDLFNAEDNINVEFECGKNVNIYLDPARFRPAEVPILLSKPTRIAELTGDYPTVPQHISLRDIVRDQIQYYEVPLPW